MAAQPADVIVAFVLSLDTPQRATEVSSVTVDLQSATLTAKPSQVVVASDANNAGSALRTVFFVSVPRSQVPSTPFAVVDSDGSSNVESLG